MKAKPLEFEKPIYELYDKLASLENVTNPNNNTVKTEIDSIKTRLEKMKKEIYKDLSPIQILQIARHINRPDSLSLNRLICKKFYQLHGDRQFRDDPSI
eukprot:SAG22_NODE_10114_length_552_cov_0.969095_2_plen_98_part_01